MPGSRDTLCVDRGRCNPRSFPDRPPFKLSRVVCNGLRTALVWRRSHCEMSEKPPYFPLYVLDFAASGKVEAMSTEAVGAYILLLCKAWHATPPCSLPADDQTLARWARLGDDAWSRVKASVVAAWELRADGRLYQPRLEIEWRKFRELQRARQEAGRRGGYAKKAASVAEPQPSHSNATAPPQHAGLTLTLDSGSESAQSNPEERRNTQTARPHAREEKADEKFTAAADALAEWGWRQPYDACLSGIKTQIGRAIDAIQGAGADIGLIPRAVAHHKSQAKPFKSVDYARSIVLSAINERAWEAVVPVQRQETAKERVDRIMAARAAKNGAKA